LKREEGNYEIWLAEGEKCVESLKTLNSDAVVLGFVNFNSEYSEYYEDYFKNADVVIFEDNDVKGWMNTKEIVKTLKDIVNSIRVFRFKGKGYPTGYDIADFLKENDEEDFWAFYEEMPYLYKNFDNDKVVITSNLLMSNIQQPESLLPTLLDIPKGVVGVIGGRAGDGKSLYSLYCALYGWYNYKIKTTIISLEDPLFVIINRIKQLIRTKFDNRFDEYGDAITVVRLSNLNLIREGRFTQSGQAFLNLLENQAIVNELIFIDPAGMLLGDENSNQNVQLIVQYVQYIAEKNNISIILIHHKRKFTDNATEDMDILRGAGALTANARWVALLTKSANDIYLKIIKNNYLPLKRNAIILENIIDIGGSDV
ncbi:MAG: AAA family ATPase, partial [Caldisphaera sp.]